MTRRVRNHQPPLPNHHLHHHDHLRITITITIIIIIIILMINTTNSYQHGMESQSKKMPLSTMISHKGQKLAKTLQVSSPKWWREKMIIDDYIVIIATQSPSLLIQFPQAISRQVTSSNGSCNRQLPLAPSYWRQGMGDGMTCSCTTCLCVCMHASV